MRFVDLLLLLLLFYFIFPEKLIYLSVFVCGATSQELFAAIIFFGCVSLKYLCCFGWAALCPLVRLLFDMCTLYNSTYTDRCTLCPMWLVFCCCCYSDWILSHSTLAKCANTLIFASSFLLHISTMPFDLIFLSFNFQFVKDLIALKLVDSFLNFFHYVHCIFLSLSLFSKTQFFNA